MAFGSRGGAAPDRFLVGPATLNLLAEVAEDRTLLCLVDDAQWLDEASAQLLAFVARRVAAERMALVFALRDANESDVHPFSGLPELRLDGLGETDARQLLTGAVRAPLDPGVRDRIIAEARGNPLALLELPRGTPSVQLAGGFQVPDVLNVPSRIEDEFRRRSGSLPADTQLLLVVAAAEPTGDVELLWRAATQLGIPREAVEPAEAVGLLAIDTRVRFRHPLARPAVYRAATPPDRRRAHGALAAATDPQTDPDRRAWHRAQSAQGTDEDAAADLERSANRARGRGGLAAAAAFLQRAAELTPEPAVPRWTRHWPARPTCRRCRHPSTPAASAVGDGCRKRPRPPKPRPHRPRTPHRPAGSHRGDLPGGQRTTVPQPPHHRSPSTQYLRQTRHHLPQAAQRDAAALTRPTTRQHGLLSFRVTVEAG
ncbi:hypothetical protein [Streptosporangium sp. H16]|uniref:hypothetical protein n=1 Tax=Streptosporangium sp. H16 TaxID=3444184 RepID=UPI003F7B162D